MWSRAAYYDRAGRGLKTPDLYDFIGVYFIDTPITENDTSIALTDDNKAQEFWK
jgi:hypothetical protein